MFTYLYCCILCVLLGALEILCIAERQAARQLYGSYVFQGAGSYQTLCTRQRAFEPTVCGSRSEAWLWLVDSLYAIQAVLAC